MIKPLLKVFELMLPKSKYFPNGRNLATSSVATSEHWKDKSTGERKESTGWHRIVTNGRLADLAGQYLKKGSKAYIEGSLRTWKWKDQNGLDREVTEIRRVCCSYSNKLLNSFYC